MFGLGSLYGFGGSGGAAAAKRIPVTVSGTYTVLASDIGNILFLSGSSGDINLDILGDGDTVNFVNTTGNTYTFVRTVGSLFSDSSRTKSIAQYTAVSAVGDGTNATIIGKLTT